MDPCNPINPKDDHSQRSKRTRAPIEPMSPASEKRLGDFYDWEDEAKYRLARDSDDDSGDDPWLSGSIVTPPPRLPMNYYPKEPPVWATYGEGLLAWQNKARVEAENNTLPMEPRSSTTHQCPSQGSSSSQHRAAIEAEKTTLPLEQEIAYFNMLTEITKIDTSRMTKAQKKAHEGQIALLCNKLGINNVGDL